MNRSFAIAGLMLFVGVVHAQSSDALAARVKAMAEIPSTGGAVYSQDGKRLAFLSNRSGTPQVWVVDAAGGAPRQITQGSDPVGSVAWSPVEDMIAYDVARGGGFNAQVFVSKSDGTGVKRITSGGKEDNFSGAFAPDGRYWFRSAQRDPQAPDSWIYEPKSGKAAIAIQYDGFGGINDIQRPPNRALISRLVTRGNTNLYLHDLQTRHEILLTPHDGPAIASGALAPDGSAAYLVHNIGRDRLVVSRIPIDAAGKPGKMTLFAGRDDAEADGFTISDDGRRAVLSWNVGGRTELELVSLPDGKRAALRPPPGEVVSISDFSPDGSRVTLNVTGATQPSSAWQYDFASQRYSQIAPVATPDVDLSSLVKPELRKYQAQDGLELTGWLYLPKGFKQPGPVVLSFHGGPEGQERPTFRADYQAILAQGIAVFAPNIRGSAGFGKAFLALDNHEKRFDANRDVYDSASYLVQSGVGAQGRLGIVGGSYGGYVVMMAVTEYPQTFAAGADLFGIVNFETFFAQSTPWMGAISGGEYGDPKTQADLLKRLSPIHKLDRVRAAMLVMHGANDTNVPLVEAQQVVDTLRRNGRDVEFLLFPDEGHGWRKIPNRVKSTMTLADFFRRHLVEASRQSAL
ncbi:MAG TPA: S9 family peptidase [Steroidobacteraceae bacterium]|jgi:dipeptidyl aminopeptidase/acylaminoacyl peptidase|nr:S9 family peptidase [Steroidobacteraceae bacterium]